MDRTASCSPEWGTWDRQLFKRWPLPLQNNSTMYALIYTFTKGNWIVQPYFQFADVPTNPKIGVVKGASTRAARFWRSTRSSAASRSPDGMNIFHARERRPQQAVNLLYGPGSAAGRSLLTPTFQYRALLSFGEISLYVRAVMHPGLCLRSHRQNRTSRAASSRPASVLS